MSLTFISTAVTTMSSLYRDATDGEIIRIIVENKHINGLEISLECVLCNNYIQPRVFGV